jgi:hypothetical protein
MAALSESDLRAILGENFREVEREAQKAAGVEDEARSAYQELNTIGDKNFSCFASVIVGIALIVSAYKTVTNQTGFWIQIAVAVGFIAVGAYGYFHYRARAASLRGKLDALKA